MGQVILYTIFDLLLFAFSNLCWSFQKLLQMTNVLSPEAAEQRAVFKLAKRLVQTAQNSRLDPESLRCYLASLKEQYQRDLQATVLSGTSETDDWWVERENEQIIDLRPGYYCVRHFHQNSTVWQIKFTCSNIFKVRRLFKSNRTPLPHLKIIPSQWNKMFVFEEWLYSEELIISQYIWMMGCH